MNYAVIDNGIVTNIIWVNPDKPITFLTVVPIGDLPVAIGDEYRNGKFYHEGEEVTVPATEIDKLEAQVLYTAMMTDTLIEEG